MKVSWLAFVSLLVTGSVSAVEVPEEIPICSRRHPDLEECLRNSMQQILPRIKDGLPSLEIPPLDPMVMENVNLNYSVLANLLGNLNIQQVRSYGLSEGEVRDVRLNLTATSMELEADVFFPKGFIEGKYQGSGRIGLMRLKSAGPFNVTMKNTLVTWRLIGQLEKINGEDYMKIVDFTMNPKIEYMRLDMEGIFTNRRLTKAAVDMINNSWKYFLKQLLPETQLFWSPTMSALANQVFLKIPFDVLMPEEILA